ncbi:MAG TPA: glutaredoxin family protein [Gemmataceae bacterium]|nr:glutaredoxin family protein [Gemmataceae bacterium]
MAWTFLSRLLAGKPRQRPDLHVVVFTRETCPLCDEAWKLLRGYQNRYGFTLEAIDIDTSPNLVDEHGEWVPVVVVNGQVRFRGHVNEVLLQRLLDAP